MNRREFGALAYLAVAGCAARGEPAAPAKRLPVPPPMPCHALAEDALLERIGFGSCYVPQFEQGAVWDAVRAQSPDAFLFIGDNVYQSEENGRPELRELREAYAALAADPWFATLRAQTPVLVTWDDHDYGMNDAGAEFPARLETEALFKQVWAVAPEDPRANRAGVYYERLVGPPGRRTQLILLDARYFRTADTMLGPAQWSWLEQVLAKPADLRVLASSIPVLSQAAEGETWSKWPAERERLLALLARAGGVVIVSGDSHFGAHYARTEDVAYPLHELTSSSLNFPMPQELWADPGVVDAARVGAAYYPANFGAVDVDWSAREVRLVLHDAAGAVVSTQSAPLAALSAR